MRAYVVVYAGMCERPSRTISGEVVVHASSLASAARLACWAISGREHLRSLTQMSSISLRIAKGGTVSRRKESQP